MGFAIAEAAAEAGWTVDLVAGPVSIPEPDNGDIIVYPVQTTEEMFHQCDALFDAADVIIMAAAPCDFKPLETSPHKVKKSEASLTVGFEPTVDILRTLSQRRTEAQLLVGFAAETKDLPDQARRKLLEKRCDVVAGNIVGQAGSGFGSEENTLELFEAGRSSSVTLGPAGKKEIAKALIARLNELAAET